MSRVRFFLASVVGMAVALGSVRAHADDAIARQHFQRGVDLYDKHQYEDAEKAFRDAYAERPSPGIKQNIALSLKGQGKLVEAATLLDESLDEGQSTLKPDTKAAIERELGELAHRIGTVNVKVVTIDERRPLDNATVIVDGKPRNWHRPIRVSPDAVHVFRAHLDGIADPPEKKLAPLAGVPVDATFEMGVATGMLTIRPNIEGARISIDGNEVAHGTYSGRLSPGVHRVAISAADYATTVADVSVTAGTSIDYPVTLTRPVAPPPEYLDGKPPPPPPVPRKYYVLPYVGVDSATYRFGQGLGEDPDGKKRQVGGLLIGARGGWRFTPHFAVELLGEYGSGKVEYDSSLNPTLNGGSNQNSATITRWSLVPALRFMTLGKFRFVTAAGLGLGGKTVKASIREQTSSNQAATVNHAGSGASYAFNLDAGFFADAGPIFIAASVFADISDTSYLNGAGDSRMFKDTPVARYGATFGLGIPF